MSVGKSIALTIQIFVGKVKSLLFNMLSRFVMVFFFFQQAFIPNQRPAHQSPAQCLLPKGLPHTERGDGNYPAAALSPVLGIRVLSHSIWAAATKTPQTGGLKTFTSPCSGDWDINGQDVSRFSVC